MKLLIFIDSLRCGGAERVSANLANHWVDKGWEVTLLTLTSLDTDYYSLHPDVVRIALGLEGGRNERFLVGLRRTLRRVLAVRRGLKNLNPEVALSMMTTNNIILAFAALGLRNVITIGSEHSYPPYVPLKPAWQLLRRLTYGWLTSVVALTAESASWLKRFTYTSHVPVIPNPVVYPLPAQTPVMDPAAVIPVDRRIVLGVGRLVEEKQPDHLIRAFSVLATRYPQWLLVMVGDGPLHGTLESQAREAGLGERVLLPGRVGNVGDWYWRADIYAMTSKFEGFPNTLAEALAHGLPCVSYDCDTGPRDLIRHGTDGLLVPPNCVESLAEALGRLMQDEELRKTFGSRAIESRSRFSMPQVAGRWEQLFAELRRAAAAT